MSDDPTTADAAKNESDYPNCTVKCTKIVGPDGATCTKTCSKKATPTHDAYGSHYCSDHA